ncbi:hypothetical protein LCGC14_1955700 [marine sediment metagenome]|uniref:Uncharacterized protein n=1 Tax=marine sediment metagenome TaxID=412755 RepID=A0A0F9ID97_9ZZZZ
MTEDWINQEKRREYWDETGKNPLYADLPTEDYKKWLERKEMEEGIQDVINAEKKG